MLAYLMGLPEFPTPIDRSDATEAKKTILYPRLHPAIHLRAAHEHARGAPRC